MALPTCCCRGAPWRCWNHSLWPLKREANHNRPLFRRVCLPCPYILFFDTDQSSSQPFWGDMVAKAGAGPSPIPHASLDPDLLASAILFCLTPEAAAAAGEISIKMQGECGVATAVDSFHRNLPLDRMRCAVMPNQVAVWTYKKGKHPLHLSKAAVEILIEYSKIDSNQIRPYVLPFSLPSLSLSLPYP